MSRLASFVLCLLLTLNVHGSLSAQNSQFATGETRIPGTPITNAQVEAGLRKNREALRNTPPFQTHNAPTHFRLAEVLSQQGDPNGAIEEYQAALQLNPKMAESFRGLGAVYLDKHEWKLAEEALGKSIILKKGDGQGHYWLGRALLAQQHFTRATEAYITATQLDGRNAEWFSDLALAHMAQGKYEEAEHALHQAISLKPDLAEAHHRLEVVYSSKQDTNRLRQSTQELLEIYFRRE